MKKRIVIWIVAFLAALGICLKWYWSIPPMLVVKPHEVIDSNRMEKIDEKYSSYKSQKLLLYGSGETPGIKGGNVNFSDGVWIVRSIDPTGSISFIWPNNFSGIIIGKGTIFLDFKNDIMLSIDALLLWKNNSKILPSFYVKNDEKIFFNLGEIEWLIDKDLWWLYRNNALSDEKKMYSGFSETEIIDNITTILKREPKKEGSGNTFFAKDTGIRSVLEEILWFIDNVNKQKKCGQNAGACVRFMTTKIQEGKNIDQNIFIGLEEPLILWAKEHSNLEVNYSWESIFQKYHFDVLSNDPLAINTRDNSILTMIQSTQKPTYEMWLYLAFILSREKNWSPFALRIMSEMIRIGEILKDGENKVEIITESNNAISNLRKVLEDSYFDKKDNYLFVLKDNLKNERWENINPTVFVDDLKKLILEIDKSTLFTEYPDFRRLRRHLSWFLCIFEKNKAYVDDIRVCRIEV